MPVSERNSIEANETSRLSFGTISNLQKDQAAKLIGDGASSAELLAFVLIDIERMEPFVVSRFLHCSLHRLNDLLRSARNRVAGIARRHEADRKRNTHYSALAKREFVYIKCRQCGHANGRRGADALYCDNCLAPLDRKFTTKSKRRLRVRSRGRA